MKSKLEELESLIKEKRVYLDATCNQANLAKMLGLTVHQLSQLLNDSLQKRFNDFINEYRIKESISMLDSKEEIPIHSIAFKSGFQNEVSFYKAFKKYQGQTPTQYRNNQ